MQPVCIKIGSWVCFITLNLILLPVITTAHETEACCSQWAGCVSDYVLPCISSGIHLTVVGAHCRIFLVRVFIFIKVLA